MEKFKPTIGVEIHLEINTRTKLFSPARRGFGAPPNTLVHPIDMGYPGTLPSLNKSVVGAALVLLEALKMKVAPTLRFDRKHYYYPDLPKGYQITQHRFPIGTAGRLVLPKPFSPVTVARIQIEEDTAKQIHRANKTLLDFNRAGVPLLEIVSAPEIYGADHAVAYIKTIQETARRLGISDARMEAGSLRADVNVSLCGNPNVLGTKVEIKNMNSLRNVKQAVKNEVKLQEQTLRSGKKVLMTTKRYDEGSGQNVVMRSKATTLDYRYLVEPNIPPLRLTKGFQEALKRNFQKMSLSLPLTLHGQTSPLPEHKKLLKKWGLNAKMTEQLVRNKPLTEFVSNVPYFDKLLVTKVVLAELLPLCNKKKVSVPELLVNKRAFAVALGKLAKNQITRTQLRTVIKCLAQGENNVPAIIKKHNLVTVNDPTVIKQMVLRIVQANKLAKPCDARQTGKRRKYVLGQLMKKTQGNLDVPTALKVVSELLPLNPLKAKSKP